MPNWNELLRQARLRNYENLNVNDIRTKIENFAEMSGYPVNEVRDKIENDPMFKWSFIKDPKRQNFYELIAGDFIERMDNVSNFRKLGVNEMVLTGGAVLEQTIAQERGADPRAKSIDFTWTYNDTRYYASHKYTKQIGGTQDNQYKDLQDFIQEANRSNLDNTIFLAIADGEYYNTNNGRRGTTKIGHLRESANQRRVFALTIDDLENFMLEHRA